MRRNIDIKGNNENCGSILKEEKISRYIRTKRIKEQFSSAHSQETWPCTRKTDFNSKLQHNNCIEDAE